MGYDTAIQSVDLQTYNNSETLSGGVETTVASDESIFTQDNKSFGEKFMAWTRDEDKICTDGIDDGQIGLKEGLKSFGKGLACLAKAPFQFANSVKNAVETCKSDEATTMDKIKAVASPVLSAGLVVGAVAATALTGGAALPAIVAGTAALGAGTVGYGTYKAFTADTDGEKKQALETMGTGVFELASALGTASTALSSAQKAGVNVGEISKNPISNLANCIKATPDALKVSKANIVENLTGVIQPNSTTLRTNIRETYSKANNEPAKYTIAEKGTKIKTVDGVDTLDYHEVIMIDENGNPYKNTISDLLDQNQISRMQKIELRDYADYHTKNGALSFDVLNNIDNLTADDMADINMEIAISAKDFDGSKEQIAQVLKDAAKDRVKDYHLPELGVLKQLDGEDLFYISPELFRSDFTPSYSLFF